MAYALAARGFRYGGPNIIPSEPGFVVPRTFDSDSLWNYEIGARSDFLDRRLQLDGTLFYIDWSDIQLRQQTPSGLNYAVNAGKARSRGLEGAASWLVTPSLKLSANATYLDAELTEDFVSNPGQGIPVTVGRRYATPRSLEVADLGHAQLQVDRRIARAFVPAGTSLYFEGDQRRRRPGRLAGGLSSVRCSSVHPAESHRHHGLRR